MVPFLTPEQQEQLKEANRSQKRLSQQFIMFVYMVSTGKPPQQAVDESAEALEVWADYEERNAIKPPDGPTDTNTFLATTLMKLAGHFLAKQNDAEAELPEGDDRSSPAVEADLEERSWKLYLRVRDALADLRQSQPPGSPLIAEFERELAAREKDWLSFGSFRLRQALGQYTPDELVEGV